MKKFLPFLFIVQSLFAQYFPPIISGTGGTGSSVGSIPYNGGATALTVGTSQYTPVAGATLATVESFVQIPSSKTGTATNLYVFSVQAPGAGNTLVFTLRINGSSTALTCTISGAIATTCNDTTHSVSVAAGNLMAIQVSATGTISGAQEIFSTNFQL